MKKVNSTPVHETEMARIDPIQRILQNLPIPIVNLRLGDVHQAVDELLQRPRIELVIPERRPFFFPAQVLAIALGLENAEDVDVANNERVIEDNGPAAQDDEPVIEQHNGSTAP